jgi:hypothetical protein
MVWCMTVPAAQFDVPPSLREWVRRMPPQSDIDTYIQHLETQLEAWKNVRQMLSLLGETNLMAASQVTNDDQGRGQQTVDIVRGEATVTPDDHENRIDPMRFSPERRLILKAIRALPGDAAAPADVTRYLKTNNLAQMASNNVVTNMQRMVAAGLLQRVRRGEYAIVPAADRIALEMDAREESAAP